MPEQKTKKRSLFEVWQELCAVIDEKYEMERVWNAGGRKGTYEYKYRRGGKALCCLYAKRLRRFYDYLWYG